MTKLLHCPRCKDKSVTTKVYARADGVTTRAIICINKGCGFNKRLLLPNEKEEHNVRDSKDEGRKRSCTGVLA